MVIRDNLGNESVINKKVKQVGVINVVIGKKTPDGKTSKFFHGYEQETGHWVGIGSTEQECIERIEKSMDHIKKVKSTMNNNLGGLFG